MFNHPYICLSTEQDLPDESILGWLKSISESGPTGIVSATELQPNNKPQRFYKRKINGKNYYCAVLSRDLEPEEANAIAHTANNLVSDVDFEINWSQHPQNIIEHEIVSEDIVKAIALEAAKRNHSTWLNRKINEGWRFGQNFHSRNKISPMCREWDSLSDKYKLSEYQRFLSLLEVLNEMNLSLVQKK